MSGMSMRHISQDEIKQDYESRIKVLQLALENARKDNQRLRELIADLCAAVEGGNQ